MKSKITTGIVANDAGGAELLSSYILTKSNSNYLYFLKGPAKKIFNKKINKIVLENNLNKFISRVDKLICASSFKLNFELRAIKIAKGKKIKSIVFLDHWVNYKMRHIMKGKLVLPDIFWVTDKHAKLIANTEFPKKKIIVKRNYYLDSFKNIKLKNIFKKNSILYICDQKRKKNVKYSELESINYLIKNLEKITNENVKITIRPHPSETKKKYQQLSKHKMISISENNTLLQDIAKNEIIVGAGSMAMLVASLFRKKIYCSMPPHGKSFIPNIKKIKYLSSL